MRRCPQKKKEGKKKGEKKNCRLCRPRTSPAIMSPKLSQANPQDHIQLGVSIAPFHHCMQYRGNDAPSTECVLRLKLCDCKQVLGRSLEALITSAEDTQKRWKDSYTSVEHLMLAAEEDPDFGRDLLRRHAVTREAMEKAIKDIRGSNRVSGALPVLDCIATGANTTSCPCGSVLLSCKSVVVHCNQCLRVHDDITWCWWS
jgi:hypothetical protein